MKQKSVIRKTPGDRVFDLVVGLIVLFVIAVTLYPLIYVFSMSISDPIRAARGEVVLLPKGFSLTSMKKVLNDPDVLTYYGNTLFYTVVGTVMGILVTSLAAYPLSRKEFAYRKGFTRFIMLTMFFSGGMIPTYIIVTRYLHMYNTRWPILLLPLANAWYIVVARNFFESIPEEMIESARIDGASEMRTLISLIVPCSKPILAVLELYYAVGHWNSYFNAMLYLGKKELQPLAIYIQSVVVRNSVASFSGPAVAGSVTAEELLSALQIKYTVVVVAVVPMLLIYPLLSKYLERGLLVGAVKG